MYHLRLRRIRRCDHPRLHHISELPCLWPETRQRLGERNRDRRPCNRYIKKASAERGFPAGRLIPTESITGAVMMFPRLAFVTLDNNLMILSLRSMISEFFGESSLARPVNGISS